MTGAVPAQARQLYGGSADLPCPVGLTDYLGAASRHQDRSSAAQLHFRCHRGPVGVRIEEFFEIADGYPPFPADPYGTQVTRLDQPSRGRFAQLQKIGGLLQFQQWFSQHSQARLILVCRNLGLG